MDQVWAVIVVSLWARVWQRLVIANLSILLVLPILTACARQQEPAGSRTLASAAARKVFGAGQDYLPETLSEAQIDRLKHSMLARRQFAWSVVAKALAPMATAASGIAVPRWAGWYARDDFQRMFHELYSGLGQAGRRERRPFASDAVAAIEQWNTTAVDGMASWPIGRYDAWLGSLNSPERVHSLTGLNRTLLSPSAFRHLVLNYGAMNSCLDSLNDIPFGEPGLAPNNFSRCFDQEFPSSAALIKTSWARDAFDLQVGAYDTSAAALAGRLNDQHGSWQTPERLADPDASTIYTVELDEGARFRLAGMHIMTKELREWVWITLWWSDTPDGDFGEDRPESIKALGAPWSNYKMCVAVAFDETGAVDPELREQFPSLAASLDAAQSAIGPSSWCSNPFFEAGEGNQRSNCIGCHQHAGANIDPRNILVDEALFPSQGRKRVRENFPADYLWSFNKDPEQWATYVRGQIGYYDTYDSNDRVESRVSGHAVTSFETAKSNEGERR